jgi:hypothetical protein
MMVECRGNLNQRLKKTLLRLIQGQPDALPMLMSQKELASPVAGEAISKRSRIPVKGHAFSLVDFPTQ